MGRDCRRLENKTIEEKRATKGQKWTEIETEIDGQRKWVRRRSRVPM